MKETSKKLHKLWLIAAMALLITVFAEPAVVKAATVPTDLKQTGSPAKSVKLGWTAQSGAYGYIIRYATTPNATTFNYERTTRNEISISGLTLGTTYYAQICSVDNSQQYYSYQNYTLNWSKVVEINTAPDTISTVTQTNATNNSVTVSWAPVTGATHYLIYIGNSSSASTAQAYGTTTASSVTLQTQPNVSFYVFVQPLRKTAGADYYATTSYNYSSRSCKTIPTAPNSVSIQQRTKDTTYFTWKATSTSGNTDGYEIEIKNAKNKKIAKEDIDNIYASYKSIKNEKLFKQPFQYRMRSYVKINGQKKYSAWSPMKKYIPGAVPKKIVRSSRYATSGKLTWTKVTGATSYTVYWKTSLKGKWKAVAKNVKGTSANVKYNPKSKNNFYYIKANKVKFGKKKYNSSSDSKNLDVYGVIPRY